MSTTYDCSRDSSRAAGLRSAVNAARAGRLVVLPTDTVYGLGCDAFDHSAVTNLLGAKGRGPDMPVPVLVGSWHTIDGLVLSVSPQVRQLVKAFWPGGLSIVVEQAPSLPWNLGETEGTVMLRMPAHPMAIELLREVGPMAVSSANISGEPPACTVAEAREQLGDAVSVYLDGGQAEIGEPSTIVDMTGMTPRLLREGAISAERLAEALDIEVERLREA